MNQKLIFKDRFIKQFINYIEEATAAMRKNDYKKNNKIVKKFIKFVEEQSLNKFFSEALNELIESKNHEISIAAASNSLKFDVNIDQAVKLLNFMAKKKDIGIAALEAEMILKVYNGEIPGKKL